MKFGMTSEELESSKLILLAIFKLTQELERSPTERELLEYMGYDNKYINSRDDVDTKLTLTDEAYSFLLEEGLIEVANKNKLN